MESVGFFLLVFFFVVGSVGREKAMVQCLVSEQQERNQSINQLKKNL